MIVDRAAVEDLAVNVVNVIATEDVTRATRRAVLQGNSTRSSVVASVVDVVLLHHRLLAFGSLILRVRWQFGW